MHGDSARDIIPAPNSQVMWLCGLGAHENLRHTRLPGIECTGLRIYVDHRVITTVITVHSIYTIIMLCFRNSLVFTMLPITNLPSATPDPSKSILGSTAVFQVANALQQVLTEWTPMHRLLRNLETKNILRGLGGINPKHEGVQPWFAIVIRPAQWPNMTLALILF